MIHRLRKETLCIPRAMSRVVHRAAIASSLGRAPQELRSKRENSARLAQYFAFLGWNAICLGPYIMSKPIPTIQKYMTTAPHTIGKEQPMVLAHRMMREHRIRNLPVLHDAHIVGVISDRDLNLIETLRDVDPKVVTVEDAMTPDPYVVGPDVPLDEVVSTMAEKKFGCAVVVQHNKVVGIFTTVDACRAFAELLHTRLAK